MIKNFNDLKQFIREFDLEDVTISAWFDNGVTVRINGQVVKLPKSEEYIKNIIKQNSSVSVRNKING